MSCFGGSSGWRVLGDGSLGMVTDLGREEAVVSFEESNRLGGEDSLRPLAVSGSSDGPSERRRARESQAGGHKGDPDSHQPCLGEYPEDPRASGFLAAVWTATGAGDLDSSTPRTSQKAYTPEYEHEYNTGLIRVLLARGSKQ